MSGERGADIESRPGEPVEPSVFDMASGELVPERIYGEGAVRFVYETRLGRGLAALFLTRPWIHTAIGAYFSSRWSRRRIAPCVRRLGIDMEDFEERDYRSFNEFFTRELRRGARPWDERSHVLPAFAEGRYLAFDEVERTATYPVKGHDLTAAAVLGDRHRAAPYWGGPLLIARLCPADYHRYHYPARGRVIGYTDLPGPLHSVHPIALRRRSEILATNRRRITELATPEFGRLAYVEVGALAVGRIVQTHPWHEPFERGQEKGYFEFGGSTVLLFGERHRWRPEEHLVARTKDGIETLVRLGVAVARACD